MRDWVFWLGMSTTYSYAGTVRKSDNSSLVLNLLKSPRAPQSGHQNSARLPSALSALPSPHPKPANASMLAPAVSSLLMVTAGTIWQAYLHDAIFCMNNVNEASSQANICTGLSCNTAYTHAFTHFADRTSTHQLLRPIYDD